MITTEATPMTKLVHKGFQGQAEFNRKKGAYVGRLVNVREEVLFNGSTISYLSIVSKKTI